MEVDGLAGEGRLENGNALGQTGDAHARPVVVHAHLLVVGEHPARPDTELEAAATELVEGGDLLGENTRMAIVVGQHQRLELEGSGDAGGRGQGEKRSELVTEMVGDGERVVPEVFGPVGGVEEVGRVVDNASGDAESDRVGHAGRRYLLLPGPA